MARPGLDQTVASLLGTRLALILALSPKIQPLPEMPPMHYSAKCQVLKGEHQMHLPNTSPQCFLWSSKLAIKTFGWYWIATRGDPINIVPHLPIWNSHAWAKLLPTPHSKKILQLYSPTLPLSLISWPDSWPKGPLHWASTRNKNKILPCTFQGQYL